MSNWVIAPFSFPSLGHDIIIVNTIFCFSSKKKTGLEDVERDAAIRVTSKPKERHASITARLIRNMHRKYVLGVTGRKEGRREMRQIKSGP
jgi:hypothetical protein